MVAVVHMCGTMSSSKYSVYSQGHNLYKLQYISLGEVKIVSFQQGFQSEAIESNLFRLYLKLFTPRSNFSPSKI